MADNLAKATALFDEEKYADARAEAQRGLEICGEAPEHAASARSLKLLIRKCNTHLPELAAEPTPAPPAQAPKPAAASTSNVVRNEWFQTATHVTFSFYVKNRTAEQVSVTSEPRSLDVSIRLDNGSEFQLSHEPLFAEIDPSQTVVTVKQPKVEVAFVKKMPGIHWAAIELVGDAAKAAIVSAAPPVAALPASQAQLAYPNSKGKDWSKFKAEEEEEDKSKLSGDEGLNKLFKDIYAGASDENRRAMMKSFTESNGTVLSTNWADVGARKVDGEAPKGMEMKKFEQ